MSVMSDLASRYLLAGRRRRFLGILRRRVNACMHG